ncbi:tetratricopeptide repeat-containing sensor histidine kinase [Dyadobacter psychrotolerans]|uniref:Oxygen sensor histidine kinase NreB n=1 Tax=Dyadobacter psychrotolerans TaxID=2541721 RepID=A0A4V2Z475_9BACT|nr:sensor histidine kinase [Dyadobacter psychrotolerans]TDE15498.1 tetratricopeptide repeat protein [Dyadobacter psychrotolerans]
MINIYKLGILLSLTLVLSGIQCSKLNSKLDISKDRDPFVEKHLAGFAQDTVAIHAHLDSARMFLYKDASLVLGHARIVLKLSQKHQWAKGKILAYNLLSAYYLLDGSHDILKELSNETITLSERLHMPFYTAHARRFMAESNSEYREWDSAKANYQYALKVFSELKNDSSRAVCLENIGNLYRENNDSEKAFESYDEAYQIYGKMGYKSGQATVLQSKGYYFVRNGEYQKAEMLYNKAMQLFKSDKNFYGEINLLNDIGNAYYCDKKYDQAIEACSKALIYSKKYQSTQQTNWAHQTLGRAYKEKNMLEKAIYYSENAYYARRKLHDDNIYRQYTTYQLIYDNKQKDSAIQQQIIKEQKQVQNFLIGIISMIIAFAAFLWYNNRKLRRKNTEIKEAMIQGQTIERKRVAAELHDHLGGTLASLNWYLFGIDKKSLSEEEQKIYKSVHQMVGAAYKEVRSLSHNLMPAELEEYGLFVALSRLIGKLNENKKIEFVFSDNGLDKRYGNKIEFELYSIVLELTNNIIKHSGADHAEISITEHGRNVKLVITDNGNGIDKTSRQGVGLNNVRNRVASLNGRLMIAEQEKGTRIEIEIPN